MMKVNMIQGDHIDTLAKAKTLIILARVMRGSYPIVWGEIRNVEASLFEERRSAVGASVSLLLRRSDVRGEKRIGDTVFVRRDDLSRARRQVWPQEGDFQVVLLIGRDDDTVHTDGRVLQKHPCMTHRTVMAATQIGNS